MYRQKSPLVPTLAELFPKIQADTGSWLGTKNALYYCAQSANSFSWVLFVSLHMTAIVSIRSCLAHAPKKCTQSGDFQFDMKSPSDFKILSARKLKALFQKYKLELTTGIHACISQASCVNTREFLKDTTTADRESHLKLPIIYDTLWPVKNRIFSGQIDLLLLIASQTFFSTHR